MNKIETINNGVRGLGTNFTTTICSGRQIKNNTTYAIFDDFQFLTPILPPNDFMSFGGIFYPNFESSGAQILNDGQKPLLSVIQSRFGSNSQFPQRLVADFWEYNSQI